MPEWFLKPHPRYGTTYRILWLIVGLQLFTIWASFGDVLLLGEAYAFGVVWSFVFQALSMVVLRFADPRPREAKVPLNVRVGRYEVPVGLIVILIILLVSAVCNLLTKEVATIGGLIFTAIFFTLFHVSERYHEKRRLGKQHEHIEQFNQETTGEVTAGSLGLTKTYRKLVSIRSPHNLFMLEKALAETDPETTSIVVMTAKLMPLGGSEDEQPDLDAYDQQLMTAVVQLAEKAGKQVKPLIVPTNNPHPRRAQDRQGLAGPRADPRRLQPLHGRRADGADRLLLDQPARRQPGAADGAHPQPRARHLPRPGRRQSHSQDQRAQGAVGGRAARRRRRRRSRAAHPRRQPGQQRPVPGRLDHARRRRWCWASCRWCRPARSRSTATASSIRTRNAPASSAANCR